MGVVASALPWCVGIIALKNTSPMTTSVYVVLQPPLAAFVGVVLMGEALTGRQVLGSGLVLLGLVFVNANPIVQRVLTLVRRHIFANSKQFEILSNVEEGSTEIEMKEMKEGMESTVMVEEDGAGATVEDEVEYDLGVTGETNDFVIENHDDDESSKSADDEFSKSADYEFSKIELESERKSDATTNLDESCNFEVRSGEGFESIPSRRVEAISVRA